MRGLKLGFMVILAFALAFGCSGKTETLHMKDSAGQETVVVFPNGTVFGGASAEQATALAKAFIDSHNMSMKDMGEIKVMSRDSYNAYKESLKQQEAINGSTQKLVVSMQQFLESMEKMHQNNPAAAERTLQMVEKLSKQQGTGEITLFYPEGAGRISSDSFEYKRLISFIDYLIRENKGRKLLLVSIGSASATGGKKNNNKLAKNRAEFPIEIIEKYLVNTPHQFFKVYGTGAAYSPVKAKLKEHQRYQYTRLIAVYETDQIVGLPEEPAKDNL